MKQKDMKNPLNGQEYWRSLNERNDTPEFREFLEREFPAGASQWDDPVSRRSFLKVMGASISLAGLSACVKQPEEKIHPYVRQPEYMVPGRPLSFATAFVMDGYATGVLVTSHMGRPTKIEGNPDHPSSLGSSDIFSQASLLTLYDPDRSRSILHKGEISTWNRFLQALQGVTEIQERIGGAGIRILTGPSTSPTLQAQMAEMKRRFPQSGWYGLESFGSANEIEGARMTYGVPLETHVHFDKADVVFSIDADFLSSSAQNVRSARAFARRRRVDGTHADMNRLYVAETMPTVTGGAADHRLRITPSQAGDLVQALASEFGLLSATAGLTEHQRRWLSVVARDLKSHSGSSVVVVGREQHPEIHAIVQAINQYLGNVGSTISFTDPPLADGELCSRHVEGLIQDLGRGDVDLLLVAGTNPVYSLPVDHPLRDVISRAGMSVHLGLHVDETAAMCEWHLPESHYLEAWGDSRSADGTATIMQPLIAPLYSNTRSLHEVLTELVGVSGGKGYDIVREYWRGAHSGSDFESFWKTSLHNGVVAGTASAPVNPILKNVVARRVGSPSGGLEIQFRPDPSVWDGTWGNNGWLQELPKPVTKLTWENAAFMSPSTAERLGVEDMDVIELIVYQRSVEIPVLRVPGHADDAITVHTGYGRSFSGNVGSGIGVNIHPLRITASPWMAAGVDINRTGRRAALAITQDHHSMEGREIVRAADVEEFRENPEFARQATHVPTNAESLFPPHEYDSYAWGMSIDLNACTGCNACMIACQSENNIPVVGKEQVLNAREMHWIRVDRYFKGDLDEPEIYSQPVPCMHCENAPCEVVCPVAATTHDGEGLNVMTYNRCVGTRYCSNNCPYKVRRFNFLQYSDTETESLKLMRNPDVTVRNRGVMEKCTYCVQRISAARIDAKKEGRKIGDGDVVTACQSACPAQAIVFGDINNPASKVRAAKDDPRDYALLSELNTKPRTTYMARLRNPNPEMKNLT